MATIAQPSVQSLLIELRVNGNRLATGTSFVVATAKGPCLLTNRHNVTGRDQDSGAPLSPTGGIPDELLIWHNRSGRLGEWTAKAEPLYVNEAPRWKEHPTLGQQADFVALPLTQLQDVELLPHDLSQPTNEIQLGPADVVSVIGFPFGVTAGGVFGVWATGFLASEPAVDFNNLPIQLIDCRSRPGQSGSPVIAYRSGGMVAMANGAQVAFSGPMWNFIGIYSGRVNAESDLGIVWKASALRELLRAVET